MSDYARYAVYYAPPAGSTLAEFGASWLGWDAEAGVERSHPECGLDVAALTATPRKYGFHGTLKPPFRLAEGANPDDLDEALADLAAARAPIPGPPLVLSRIGRFLALIPSAPFPDLADLAGACVTGLDRFRAPATEAELAKRRAAGLSARQEALLVRWGYPYVLEEFRFHLTLTGALDPEAIIATEAALVPLTAPFTVGPFEVRELTLFGEGPDGRFRVIRRYPLRG